MNSLFTIALLCLFQTTFPGEGEKLNSAMGEILVFDSTNSSLPPDFVHGMAIDSCGTVWAGFSRSGLAAFDGSKWTRYTKANSGLVSDSVRILKIDGKERLWIGTGNGMGRLDLNDSSWHAYNPANSPMPVSHVWAMDVDHNNKLWFSCGNVDEGGLMTYDQGNWTLYTPDNTSLPCRAINAVLVDQNNVTWVGTTLYQGKGGLVRIDGGNWTVYDKNNSPMRRNTVEELALGLNGAIWVGQAAYFYWSYDTLEGGLFRVMPDGTNWTREDPCETGLTSNRIDAIEIDKQGRVWAATGVDWSFDYALSVFDGERWIVLNRVDSVFNRLYVTDMVCDNMGRMWLATSEGIWRVGLSGIDSLFDASQGVVFSRKLASTHADLPRQCFDLLGRNVQRIPAAMCGSGIVLSVSPSRNRLLKKLRYR